MSMGGQGTGGKRIGRTGVPLRRLMPRFEERRHGTYARTLYDACNPDLVKHGNDGESADDAVDGAYAGLPRNVALLGGYGTGKSSIIQGFERYVRYEFRWLTKLGFPSLYMYDCFADKIDERAPHWAGRKTGSIALWGLLGFMGILALALMVMILSKVPIISWGALVGIVLGFIALAIRVAFAFRHRARTKAIPGYIRVSSLLFCRQEVSAGKRVAGETSQPGNSSVSSESAANAGDDASSSEAKSADVGSSAADNSETRYQGGYVVSEIHPLGKDSGSAQQNSVKTLDIQREIVKQLIYSVAPRIVDLSHFHRLRSRRSFREYLSLLGVAALGCALLVFLVWAAKSRPTFVGLRDFVVDPNRWGSSPWLFNVVVIVAIVCCLALALKDRLRLSKVQAAAEGISLSYEDNKANLDYFDKYLDEIIFLLEKANIRYVVFEDLDRADDMSIFYELRELNMLVNSSTQMHGQTVTFIYVMGDDDFASAFESPYETAESKAKFFDVNVYVRPFVFHENSMGVLQELMEGKESKSSEE